MLSESQLTKFYYPTLNILKNTGNLILSDEAIDILKKAGCKVGEKIVKVPPHLVEKAIESVPKQITVYDRQEGTSGRGA